MLINRIAITSWGNVYALTHTQDHVRGSVFATFFVDVKDDSGFAEKYVECDQYGRAYADSKEYYPQDNACDNAYELKLGLTPDFTPLTETEIYRVQNLAEYAQLWKQYRRGIISARELSKLYKTI